ncbi:hypothetical protein ADINL_2863 [Nitrincola lacisaponensis]|uniref:Uncharacterized protein n=1 Tax=Nitrincola lacisaponensis TaxID=267850 RepID=A0A063XW14_9GAMM|nr:hypothetical protein ADINL_2863 [Nitrincola lacisaponensis]
MLFDAGSDLSIQVLQIAAAALLVMLAYRIHPVWTCLHDLDRVSFVEAFV